VESISSYLEAYIEENLPKTAIDEAVQNRRSAQVLNELRSMLSVDLVLGKETIREAVMDGKQKIDESSKNRRAHFRLNSFIGCRIFGDGVQRRTFTHIQDLTNAMILAGLDPKSDGGIFNIGGADRLSLREAAEKIAKKFDAQVVTMDWPELDKKLETGDTVFDSSSLESLFHCQFQRRFDEWLGES
jgi:nucleoside-diphosphate-sugar epimerase